jgi:hypothetical protein
VECKKDKPLCEFYLKKNGRYHSWCNDCRKEKKKIWDIENKNHRKEYNEINKGDIYLYKEADPVDNYHIFYKMSANSVSTLHVLHKTNTRINIINEGIDNEPNGNTSSYTNMWELINSSNKEGNLNYDIGNMISNGEICKISDAIPIIGNNSEYTSDLSNNRNVGLMFSRFQKSNDDSEGDIITDTPTLNDVIPDQSTASSTQIKFSNATNSTDDFYVGWWIKINSGTNINQVRKIVAYNGSLRVAIIDKPWTTQNPGNATNISLYNFSYYSLVFEESNKVGKFISTSSKEKQLDKIDYISLEAKGLNLSDTTTSINSTTGALLMKGGISIYNDTLASSSTNGGTFTSYGGGAFKKNLYVGENIGIGGNGDYLTNESLYIKQTQSKIKLENIEDEYSYIDFKETDNSTQFGILSKISKDMLNFTYTTTSQTPDLSPSAFTIMSNGNIGIKTTSNINSAITFDKNNIISLTENDGYIGILAGSGNNINNSNTCGASILLYGADSNGDIIMNTGTIGNIKLNSQDIVRFMLDKNGIINMYSTEISSNSTSGALCIKGGASIEATENASSYTCGGALTIGGGASIKKDVYIEGDLYVKGTISSDELIVSNITFSDFTNCTLNTYGNSSIILNGTKVLLSFYAEVYPTNASENCQFEFELPEKISNLNNRMELIATCNGYTDDTNLISLFNTLCVGKTGTNKGIIKFQSNSINLHYLSIICKYSI